MIYQKSKTKSPNNSLEPTPISAVSALSRAALFVLGQLSFFSLCHNITQGMKSIITISIAAVLLAVGCSKKEGAATLPQFNVAQGDMTAPPQVFTNTIGSSIRYRVEIKLSSAKSAELFKFAQQHPGREIDFVAASQIITKMQMGTNYTEPPVGMVLDCDSLSKVKAVQDLWTN